MKEKNFDNWNKVKKKIDNLTIERSFEEGDIFFAKLGLNIGFEQNGKGKDFLRPIVIVKKHNKYCFLAVPLTKSQKQGAYYYSFSFKEEIISTAILSQIKLLDARRLMNKIGHMKKMNFLELNKKISRLFY